MPVAVIVHWYGPYSDFDYFKEAMKRWSEKERILYMALGPYNRVRYIGMTQNAGFRLNDHPKLEEPGNKTFYTGRIATQGISGRRSTKHAPDLMIAEHTLIYYLRPELNTKLINTPPNDSVSVYSRFFKAETENEEHDPLPKFPSHLAFDF